VRIGTRVTLITTSLCVAYYAALLLFITVANLTAPPDRFDPEMRAVTRFGIYVILFSAATAFVLLPVMIASGVLDRLQRQPASRLYMPFVSFVLGSVGVLVISTIGAIDLLTHNLTLRWQISNETEVRILNAVLLAWSYLSLGWWTWEMLRGRGVSRRASVSILGGVAVAALTLVLVLLRVVET
jgi:hypothetical protein